jgi:hypothetical protein
MSDARPKPRLNPWPVSIIAFFTLAICGVVTFVIFCTRNPVDLVAADYYEQELRYQDQIDRANRATSLQAPAEVTYNTHSRVITVVLPASHQDAALKGWIQLYRPSSAGLDQKIALRLDTNGAQTIDAKYLTNGLWHVRVSWNLKGADYYFDQKLVIGGGQTSGKPG